MCANREHLALLRHLESGIYTDSVISTHLLRIHASHAGADNNIRHFVHTQSSQEGQSLCRVNGYVGSNDIKVWQQLS